MVSLPSGFLYNKTLQKQKTDVKFKGNSTKLEEKTCRDVECVCRDTLENSKICLRLPKKV